MLRYYAEHFPAVEINNSFYRMPAESLLRQWAEEVPDGFRFALKAFQGITHRKRLKEVDDVVAQFFAVASALGSRLGPVLVQLPPNFKKDLPRLEAFLRLVPPEARVTLEFRHASWFDEEVYALLRSRGAALCIAQDELETPPVSTTGWGYLRLRQVDYSDEALREWVRFVRAQEWTEAHVFFKHEDTGTGPKLARSFREIYDASAP
jgi:uncharacterized protein YecE (DUF72 family)